MRGPLGSPSVRPSVRPGWRGGRWSAFSCRADPAGVAQPVEHLFCKQVVRGSSPLASSTSFGWLHGRPIEHERRIDLKMQSGETHRFQEGCPSGQREQAVNLPAQVYVGSNPTPSTGRPVVTGGQRTGVEQRESTPALGRRSQVHAGVAQLVERQPSKLNVAGSNPVSRSSAHLAQLVEHVLGKDEVTSSILVVGSKRPESGGIKKTEGKRWPKRNSYAANPT